ncbi:uncharacterized protein HMPREF1541_10013 [Cyphellophora europaea CBS 101466]|uniref:Uncharacterized protein n=1 Tax=Cyphellophora europaea (strain CBS 101466) TaxID=1220924 RepID=W2S8T1_CYPE1|nr:uncharacterized protein HMPREF1541_10013 [Cyphellophora europaea CBS 101466]ETN45136.1 hypothetical protein HMPREF1541_10013 [Cyphellophora europaea CBS 101466]
MTKQVSDDEHIVGTTSAEAVDGTKVIAASLRDPGTEAIRCAKDTILEGCVTRELRRAEISLDHERLDLAVDHVRNARAYCKDFEATEQVWRLCRNMEALLRHWALQDKTVYLTEPTKTHSIPLPEAAAPFCAPSVRIDSDVSLFARLMREVQQRNGTPAPGSPVQESPQLPPPPARTSLDQEAGIRDPASSSSSGSFEGIDELLPRLKSSPLAQAPRLRPEPAVFELSTTNAAARISKWYDSHPRSPSLFKNSEVPSPRRHSFPIASPGLPPSPTSPRHERKRSLHIHLNVLAESEPRSRAETLASTDDSASNYSQKKSQGEMSTALSDTPALTKLVDDLQSNPFAARESAVAQIVRKLSLESPSALGPVDSSSVDNEHGDVLPPSPLRVAFGPEDLPTQLNQAPSLQPRSPASQNTPPPLPLQTHSRLTLSLQLGAGNAAGSPTRASPLRETSFFPESGPKVTRHKPPPLTRRAVPHSRLPRPMKQSSGPVTASNPAISSSAASWAPTYAFTLTSSPQAITTPPAKSFRPPPNPPLDTISQRRPLPGQYAANSSPSTPSTRARRNASIRVSKIAARFEHELRLGKPKTAGIDTPKVSRNVPKAQGSDMYKLSRSVPNAERPPWQIPGNQGRPPVATTAPQRPAGFARWASEMGERRLGAVRGAR